MTSRRDEIIASIVAARARHFHLPGTETDVAKRANDWVAAILPYLSEATTRYGVPPTRDEFEDSLTKAAAIIVAALEHTEAMAIAGHLRR